MAKRICNRNVGKIVETAAEKIVAMPDTTPSKNIKSSL